MDGLAVSATGARLPGMGVLKEEAETERAKESKSRDMAELKLRKAWETAKAGFGQGIFMAFMLWMSGSSLQIFSIMMTALAVMQPLRALLGVGAAFAPYKDLSPSVLLAPKLLYCAIQLLFLGVGIWKCSTLGLIPNSAADFYAAYSSPFMVRSCVLCRGCSRALPGKRIG